MLTFSSILFAVAIFFSTNVEERIVSQAIRYLDNIEHGKYISENYWAFSELYFNSCNSINLLNEFNHDLHYIIQEDLLPKNNCENRSRHKLLFLKNIAIEFGYSKLAFYFLLYNQNQFNRNDFYETFMSLHRSNLSTEEIYLLESLYTREPISASNLDFENESYEFFIYHLLYTYEYENILSNDFLVKYQSSFDNYNLFSESSNNLINSLKQANSIFLLFENEQYVELSTYYFNFKEFNDFPISDEKIRQLKALSYIHYAIGRYDVSLEIQRNEISEIAEFSNNKIEIDDSEFKKATYLYELGKFNEAKIIFESLIKDSLVTIDYASLYNNLSLSYNRLGQKNKYVSYLLKALDETNDQQYQDKLTILSNLFFYYTSIRNDSRAIYYLNLAKEIALNNNDQYMIANIHAFTGSFSWHTLKNASFALSEFRKASNVFNPETDFYDYSSTLLSMGDIYLELDSLNKAESIFQYISDLSSINSNNIKYLESKISLLELALIRNQKSNSDSLIVEISQYSLTSLDFEKLVKYHSLLLLYHRNFSKNRRSVETFEPILHQVIERAKTSIDSQTGYWVQSSDYLDAFNIYSQMLIDNKNMIATLNLLDEYKTINDVALYNSPILRANKLSEEDLATDNLLNERIVSLRTQYLNETDNSRKIQIKSQIDQLSAQREDILNKLREKDRESDLSIWEIQNKIQKNELVIHFTEIGKFLYISKISKDNIDVDIIDFDYETQKFFESVANSVATSETNLMELHQIFKKLKLDTIESNFTKITIIPDNYLYRIPIDILPISEPSTSNSYGSTMYFIEKYEVRYFTSLKEYLTNNRNSRSNNITDFSAFAISDFGNFSSDLTTLPFATNEVQNIDATLEAFTQKNLFVESQATKESFLNEASRSQIVHVATHSEVSEQDPLFSKIYLNSSSNSEEEALYAYELFDANMNSDLIMLNSCSSGSGEYLQGSGIVGITRALRYAGANSLALNLWAVNDKIASEFAYEFYKSINEGNTKSEAMRDAKLYLLETGNANPHYWGAYMLIGNPEPLTNQTNRSKIIFPLFILLLGTISFAMRS